MAKKVLTEAKIHRNTSCEYSTEEKIRIVLDGLRGDDTIAEPCRSEEINQYLYYKWSKKISAN